MLYYNLSVSYPSQSRSRGGPVTRQTCAHARLMLTDLGRRIQCQGCMYSTATSQTATRKAAARVLYFLVTDQSTHEFCSSAARCPTIMYGVCIVIEYNREIVYTHSQAHKRDYRRGVCVCVWERENDWIIVVGWVCVSETVWTRERDMPICPGHWRLWGCGKGWGAGQTEYNGTTLVCDYNKLVNTSERENKWITCTRRFINMHVVPYYYYGRGFLQIEVKIIFF